MGAGLAALALSLVPAPVAFGAVPPTGLDVQQTAYVQALTDARRALDVAGPGEADRVARALSILDARAPGEQEAIDLLNLQPPDMPGARARLDADITAFDHAVRDPDPVLTEQRLRQVLAQGRYHPDEGPMAAVGRFIVHLIQALTRPGQGWLSILLILLLAGLVMLVVVLLVPALRNPLLRRARPGPAAADGPGGVPEYFGTAERLAGAGDYGAAVRALVAGTMELILGERGFTASPLTVRETFGRSGALAVLRPLLQAFERSWYGHHAAAAPDYTAAATAARAFRDLLLERSAAA